MTLFTVSPNRSERRRGHQWASDSHIMKRILSKTLKRLLKDIRLFFIACMMAPATTGVQSGAAAFQRKTRPGSPRESRNGTRGGYSKQDGRTAERPTPRNILCHKLLSRNGEDGDTQIGQAPGNEKGSPHALRTGTRAEMPAATRLSRGEGGAADVCRRKRACGEKGMLRSGEGMGKRLLRAPVTRRVSPASRRLKCRQL